MRLGFPDAGNDPPDTMTRQAYDLNTEGFGPGTNGPLVIAADMPGAAARSRGGAVRATGCAAMPGVAFVPAQFNDQGDAAIVTVIPERLAAGRGDLGPRQPAARRHGARAAAATRHHAPRSAA